MRGVFSNVIAVVILLAGLAAWILLGTRPAAGEQAAVDVAVPNISTDFLNVDLRLRTEGLRSFGDIPVKVPPEQYFRPNPFSGL